MNIEEFLEARYKELEQDFEEYATAGAKRRMLAQIDVFRAIIDWHKNWPVLVRTEPVFEKDDPEDLNSMTFRMTQQIEWMTHEKYVLTFGEASPAAPILMRMAVPFQNHPDFNEKWRI